MHPFFVPPLRPLQLAHPHIIPSVHPHHPTPIPRTRTTPTTAALLSVPFPLPDLFAFPAVAFTNSTAATDYRPELLGSLLWTAGLYLGFSQRERWGSAMLSYLTARLVALRINDKIADGIASAVHSLPFLAVGFGTDALLRHANGGSAVWAIAAGLSVAMYGGIYELGRASAKGKTVGDEEGDIYGVFEDFAGRRLTPRGMCHLIDIRAAVKNDPKARRLNTLSDERLRRFMRSRFPKARRSPNGYYRGVSIRQNATIGKGARASTQTKEDPW